MSFANLWTYTEMTQYSTMLSITILSHITTQIETKNTHYFSDDNVLKPYETMSKNKLIINYQHQKTTKKPQTFLNKIRNYI